jgi:starch phosphorylase
VTALVAPRTAGDAAAIGRSIRQHATYSLGKRWEDLADRDRFTAVALSVRDRLVERRLATEDRERARPPKRVCYLSMEYLIGRSLAHDLDALGLREAYRAALEPLGASLDAIEASEPDAALGNGGLGRLAACFLDSFATLGIAGWGYGILYEYGLFKQQIVSGEQRELPDNWLAAGTPWILARPDEACLVPIYGRIEHGVDRSGAYNPMWMDWRALVGVPHDLLVPGHGGQTVNVLRLYSARASHEFDMRIFNEGDYVRAVEQKIASETVSKVLYPSDAIVQGRELRLVQEYFLAACAVRDIVRRFEAGGPPWTELPARVAIQINDTHPSLAIVELLRILVDERDLAWDAAWQITQAVFGFTNHTLAPEALERWPVPLLEHVLPRHLELIFEINRRFLATVAVAFPADPERLRRMSLIEESRPQQVRMTHLAVVGSHAVNGVSELHGELVKSRLLPDFVALAPARFRSVTNGISPRAWLLGANPRLAALITETIGDGWITELEALAGLEPFARDAGFQDRFLAVKRANKHRLAGVIREDSRTDVDLDSLFDVHVKRIHAYKRQLLKLLHVVDEYLAIVDDGRDPATPRTFVFAGKAAPGYAFAKDVIRLIHDVAHAVDGDARARRVLRVVFVPDYRVSVAEAIIPAADLSEQISTAGTEASGTSNMKLALNGAVTIATRDGSNMELLRAIGPDDMFVFGLDAEAARTQRIRPRDVVERDPRVRRIVEAFSGGRFASHGPDGVRWVARMLLADDDAFLHLADLPAYLDAQARVAAAFCDRRRWAQMAIHSVARVGFVSSDRAVRAYARDIWGVPTGDGR